MFPVYLQNERFRITGSSHLGSRNNRLITATLSKLENGIKWTRKTRREKGLTYSRIIAMRKQYSANLKAQLVLKVLKEEKALSQIASEHGIHPNQLRRWKTQAIDGLPTVFADEQRATQELKATHERELEELYTEIGRLEA
jgi:transposase